MKFANMQATSYNDTVVRQFAIMTVVWGVVGMLVGVIIAAQLTWPELNLGIPWLTYGRLRPLHTNAVIFAFGGCGLFASAYYVVQRTCNVRLFSDKLAAFTFWGWQLVILLAAITLPLGYTSGKEYAELEWPIDILITLVWVAFAVVFFGTVGTRKVRHIYVANWFFGAFIIAVALLHLPVDTIGSRYGVLDASLPMPALPVITLEKLRELLPSALVIAFLAAIESLLSAMVSLLSV